MVTHFSVLKVSLAYLSPGARLQINIPTELPPKASIIHSERTMRNQISLPVLHGQLHSD